MTPADVFLRELEAECRRRGVRRRQAERFVAECAGHLEESTAELEGAGYGSKALHEAMRRFGRPGELAASYARIVRPRGRITMQIIRTFRNVPKLRWASLSAAGLLVGIAVGLPAGLAVEAVLSMVLVLPVIGALVGGSLGASQALALGRRLRAAAAWILSSATGAAIGLTGGTVLVEWIDLEKGHALQEPVALAIIGGSLGLTIGLLQGLQLPGRRAGAALWVGLTTATMAVALAAGGVAARAIDQGIRGPGGFVTFVLVAALTAGALSAVALGHVEPRTAARGRS